MHNGISKSPGIHNYCMYCTTSWCIAGFTILLAAVIGFVPATYTVMEGAVPSANLSVELISGQFGRDVIVLLNIQSLTATGMWR